MVIPDFLPLKEAEELSRLFLQGEYERKKQGSRSVFKGWGNGLPGGDEIYTAAFWRSRKIESALGSVAGKFRKLFGEVDLRAHKMGPGDHFRCHVDERVGEMGFTLTLSRDWKWDWGGLLMVMEDGVPVPHLPRFNELVVIEGQPHFVTQVSPWAKEPRLTLVGFGKGFIEACSTGWN